MVLRKSSAASLPLRVGGRPSPAILHKNKCNAISFSCFSFDALSLLLKHNPLRATQPSNSEHKQPRDPHTTSSPPDTHTPTRHLRCFSAWYKASECRSQTALKALIALQGLFRKICHIGVITFTTTPGVSSNKSSVLDFGGDDDDTDHRYCDTFCLFHKCT